MLHELMGSGTFGMVYAVFDSRTGEPLAVKEMRIKDKYVGKSTDFTIKLKLLHQSEYV